MHEGQTENTSPAQQNVNICQIFVPLDANDSRWGRHHCHRHAVRFAESVSISNMPHDTRITIGLGKLPFHDANHHHRGQVHKHVRKRRRDDRRRTNRTHRLSLCHRVILHSVAHWWVLARTPTVHQCLYGGRPWVAQDTLHATPPLRQDQGLQRHALVTNMFAEPVCCDRAWVQKQFTSPPPIQEGPNRKSGSSTSSRILKSTRHAANTHVQQVVNTVEVKTPRIIKKTLQGDKVDPDDDQSGKDQSGDQTGRDSSDSVRSRSRSSDFRKSRSKSRTRKDQSKLVCLKTGSSCEPSWACMTSTTSTTSTQ